MRARQALPTLFLGAVAVTAYGCDDLNSSKTAANKAQPAAATAPAAPGGTAVAVAAITPSPATTPLAQAIEAAEPGGGAQPQVTDTPTDAATAAAASAAGGGSPATAAPSPLLIRTEVLLDRANFSPGVIDGRPGQNLTNALAVYRKAHGMAPGANIDPAVLSALTARDKGAVTQTYVITADDEAGPFIGKLPAGFVAQSKLDRLGYTDPVQALAAKFHMSEDLLKALNPGADFTKTGANLTVTRPADAPLPEVAKVEVDKAANQVRAMDAGGKILAAFPATVGSTERPAPSGELTVKAVAPNPNYTYDPSKLTFGPKSKGILTIKPGPNNPVGSTWIALSRESYGIHGTPEPSKVGKTASHGCVRLTNWDAAALGKALSKGTPVDFVGETTKS